MFYDKLGGLGTSSVGSRAKNSERYCSYCHVVLEIGSESSVKQPVFLMVELSFQSL